MVQLPAIEYPGSSIPRVIFQTWKTKELPNDMAIAVQNLKDANPEFIHELFGDEDCRKFIQEHFPREVLYAFDVLQAGAFKADLWRYCVLYIHGGVYLDIKYVPINGFSFESLIHKEFLCKDTPNSGNGVYNAIMITMPGNPLLAEAIKLIYTNCKNKYYGNSALSVTGPLLLKQIMPHNYNYNLIYNHPDSIYLNGKRVLRGYDTYRRTVGRNTLNTHYSVIWTNRRVYKKIEFVEDN